MILKYTFFKSDSSDTLNNEILLKEKIKRLYTAFTSDYPLHIWLPTSTYTLQFFECLSCLTAFYKIFENVMILKYTFFKSLSYILLTCKDIFLVVYLLYTSVPTLWWYSWIFVVEFTHNNTKQTTTYNNRIIKNPRYRIKTTSPNDLDMEYYNLSNVMLLRELRNVDDLRNKRALVMSGEYRELINRDLPTIVKPCE
jgi:hypothetical protein